jgi:hypothetical protein
MPDHAHFVVGGWIPADGQQMGALLLGDLSRVSSVTWAGSAPRPTGG